MGSKCITALWISLTMILAAAVTLSVLSPVWFENDIKINMLISIDDTMNLRRSDTLTFGLLRYCKRYQLEDVMFKCDFYDLFNGMPSIAWIISGALFCIGMGLFLLVVVLSVFGVCLRRSRSGKFRVGLAYIQSVGVAFLCIAILLYPVGLNSHLAWEVCGTAAGYYAAGDCKIAWGYVLGIMAVSLTIFCPILAKFSIGYKTEYTTAMYDSESDMLSTSPSSTTKVMTTV